MDMPLCIDSHSKALYSYRYEALCKTEDGVKEGKTAKLVGVGYIADDYDGAAHVSAAKASAIRFLSMTELALSASSQNNYRNNLR